MDKVQYYECPGCGASVNPNTKECQYCGNPVIIKTIDTINKFTPLQLNKYALSYRKQLVVDPSDRELNRSMGLCFLKLKLYDKANEAFQRAITDNFEDANSYFYAAVGLLRGKKAFVTPRPDIDKAIEYLNAANMIAPDANYYALLAYIKKDYFQRKYLRITPNWEEELKSAQLLGYVDFNFLSELLCVDLNL